MAEYALGRAEGEIVLTYRGDAVDKAKRDVDSLQKGSLSTSSALDKTSKSAGLMGAAIAGGLALAVNSAANFEQRMSAIGAVTGATGDDMDKMRAKALQLGKDTKYSATEAAMAMEELGKAGLTVPEIMNGAADATVALAAAGEVELPRAAEIASNAMNMFNLNAEQMPHVADLLAGAANASAVSVDELAMSLSQAGAVANTVGLSIDDTTAAIGLLGNAGIKGSDAGTSLKTMLMNLQPVTDKQIALFKKLGIVTKDGSNQFFDAKGNIKSMADISGVLSNALKGMTKQQKLATLETMFGSDAIRAASVFADQGSKGFNKFSKSMSGISAADVAAKRMDNLKGDLEQLKGSLETIGIALGSILIPALRQVAGAVTEAANWFLNLSDSSQKIIVGIVAAVGAILLFVAATIKVVKGIQTVVEVVKVLRAAMATTWVAALGPIALVIAAIVAIGVAIVILWKKSETFRSIVLAVWAAIQTAAQAVAAWFTGTFIPAMAAVWNAIKTGLSAVAAFFTAIWNGIKAVVTAVFSAIAAIITTYVNIWKTVITTALNVIKAVWSAIWTAFGPIIKAVFDLIKAIIVLALTIILGVLKAQFTLMKVVVTAVWNAIKAVTSTTWNAIKAVVSAVANAIKAVVSTVFNAIKAVATAVWHAIKAVVTTEVNGIKATVTAVFNAVKAVVTSIWNAIDRVIGDKIRAAYNTVKNVVGQIRGFFAGAIGWLVSAGRDIIQGLINGITHMIPALLGKVTGLVQQVTGKVKSLFKIGSPSKVMAEIGKDVGRGLAVGLGQSREDIIKAAQAMAEHARDAINAQLEKKQISPKAAAGLRKFLADQIQDLRDFTKKRDDVTAKLEEAKTRLEDAIKVRDDYAKAASDAARSFGAVTSITAEEDQKLNAGTLVAGMQARLDAIRKFQSQLAMLTAAGLNNQSYDQLVQAGVETGSQYAQAILDGGPQAVTNINDIQKQIDTASNGLGADAAQKLYQAGVDAAQGLVNGLKSKRAEIIGILQDIAEAIVKQIRKTLKMKSPSRVMIKQAEQMMQGLIVGIDGAAGDVLSSMKNAVTPLPKVLMGVTGPGVTSAAATAKAATPDAATSPAASDVPLIGTQNVYYPQAEPASQAATRQRTKSANVGRVG